MADTLDITKERVRSAIKTMPHVYVDRWIAVRAGGDHPSADGIHQIDLMNLGWRERWDVAFLLDVIEHLPDDVVVRPGRA
jgi:hypothetical protein